MASPSAAVLLLVRDPERVEPALPRILPGRALQALRREDLRVPPLELVRRLRRLRVDEVVVLTDNLDAHEKLWRIQALGAAPLAPRRYLLDLRGQRLVLSAARFAARDLPLLACGLLLSGPVLLRTRRILDRLLALPRHHPAPATGRRICFLRSDLWCGIPAGGSVAHTAGVAQGFGRIGAELFFISTDPPALVDPRRQPVHLVPPRRLYNVLREVPYFAHALRFDREAARVLARRRADLIYHRFDPGSVSGVLRARRAGVPLVLEFNGSEVWIAEHWDRPFRRRGLFAGVEAANLRHADLVVVVSEPLREMLLQRGVEEERILVQPNGVDPDRYYPGIDGAPVRRRRGIEGRVVIGFIGTFGLWHGATVLARAARRVLAERRQACFLFVGDGKERAGCEAILADQGDRAVFTGTVPQAEGPEHLAAMDILVAPHVGNPDGSRFFGSPTKLFEYMAMGRGIVASRLEQIGEVLEDSVTAILVPPGDEGALARSVLRLIDDPGLRRRLGQAARRRAVLRHSWEAHVRGIAGRLADRGLVRWI
jgi:glycosyltransferase involved in cell wall biosynthesis